MRPVIDSFFKVVPPMNIFRRCRSDRQQVFLKNLEMQTRFQFLFV